MGWFSTFWVLWGLLGVLCVWEILVFLVFSLIFTGLGLRRCAFRWTRFLGGGRRGHFFRNSWGGLRGHPGEIVGKFFRKTSFSPLFVFLQSRVSGFL